MTEFDFREFLKYYLNHYLFVFLFIFLGLMTMIVYTNVIQVPLYQSHTSIVLARSGDSNTITQSDVSLNANLVTTYREIIKSKLILDQVIKNLNLNITDSELKSMINVTSVEDTELIDISVSNPDKVTAMNIANQIAMVFKNEITSIYNIENVSIVDKAAISNAPYNIHPLKQYIMGVLAGFVIASIIILIMFSFDDTIKKREEIEEKVGLSLLGTIPINNNAKKHAGEIVLNTDPKSITSEQFRTLTTNLKFASVDKKKKTFLITSSMQGEGKSFIAANLATSLAQSGAKVLLVDCDIRRGRQHYIFTQYNQKGLSDLLVDSKGLDNINSYITKTKTKNLSVLFRGSLPPNPAELLGSEKNKSIIKALKQKFDIVIFDSAPVNGGLTDSLIMSNLVDGVIIVSAYKITSVNLLKETKEQISKVKARILGVVLNKTDKNKINKYYGNYYR